MVPDGSDGGSEKPDVNVTRSIKDAIKDVEQLAERRRKDVEKLEKVRWDLYQLEKAVLEREGPAPQRRRRRPAALPGRPAPTAEDLQMKAVENGRAVVTFDNAGQMTLPRTLKHLAAILASDEGESPDDLVAWKSYDRLGELLEKSLDRKFARHSLSQLLWRLREALTAAGFDRDLIEGDPARGARLRLKRRRPAALRVG